METKTTVATQEVLTQRVLAACDAIGAFIEWWGFKAIHGRIWLLLCVSRRPLAQREIAAVLGVSRALVSTAIAELTGYRLVRATSEHRNAPYEATLDVWGTISDVLRAREWMILERIRQALEAATQEAERLERMGAGPELAFDLKRLRLLLRMTELAQMLLRFLIALGGADLPRGFSGWLTRAMELMSELRSHDPNRPPQRSNI
jgi:DNA-binding transcriptional regulator GbsR (MarR family)